MKENVWKRNPIENVSLRILFIYLLQLWYLYRTMQVFKGKIVGAKKGYDLLKKKSDALKKAFNQIMLKIVDTKKRMGKEF